MTKEGTPVTQTELNLIGLEEAIRIQNEKAGQETKSLIFQLLREKLPVLPKFNAHVSEREGVAYTGKEIEVEGLILQLARSVHFAENSSVVLTPGGIYSVKGRGLMSGRHLPIWWEVSHKEEVEQAEYVNYIEIARTRICLPG